MTISLARKWMPFVRLTEKVCRTLGIPHAGNVDLVKSSKARRKPDDPGEYGTFYFRNDVGPMKTVCRSSPDEHAMSVEQQPAGLVKLAGTIENYKVTRAEASFMFSGGIGPEEPLRWTPKEV